MDHTFLILCLVMISFSLPKQIIKRARLCSTDQSGSAILLEFWHFYYHKGMQFELFGRKWIRNPGYLPYRKEEKTWLRVSECSFIECFWMWLPLLAFQLFSNGDSRHFVYVWLIADCITFRVANRKKIRAWPLYLRSPSRTGLAEKSWIYDFSHISISLNGSYLAQFRA